MLRIAYIIKVVLLYKNQPCAEFGIPSQNEPTLIDIEAAMETSKSEFYKIQKMLLPVTMQATVEKKYVKVEEAVRPPEKEVSNVKIT